MRQKLTLRNVDKSKTLEEGLEEFLLTCKIKNLRPSTIRHYQDIVNIFYKMFPKNTPCKEINKKAIDKFIVYLQEQRKEKDISINSTLINLRVFLYYLMRLEYMPTFKISKIKCNKPIIETYSDAEIKILLKKPDLKECNFLEYRNWVIINFFLAEGCRARTLVNLKIKDLDFENDLITYMWTKNRHQQIVPMSITLKRVLLEYLQYRKGEPDDYLFVTAYGGFLQVDQLSHNLNAYNKRRGVVRTGVHRWRHTFAKKWILNNGDIFRLQKLLSHSTMDMVKNYVNMFSTDLSNDFNKFNPLESMTEHKEHIKMKRGK